MYCFGWEWRMENRIPGCHFPGGFFFFELHLRVDLGLLIKGRSCRKKSSVESTARPAGFIATRRTL
jgi:hypothetical protein